MLTASKASWLSGIAAASAFIAHMVVTTVLAVLEFGWALFRDDETSLPFIISSIVVPPVFLFALFFFSVRAGLRLAKCTELSGWLAFANITLSLIIIGVWATRPIETHVVVMTMEGDAPSNLEPGSLMPLASGAMAVMLTPFLVSYIVGLAARRHQSPPDASL